MVSAKDVHSEALIMRTAQELQKMEEMKPPEYAEYVKTGVHKERPPTQENWWFIRSASVLRKVYIGNSVGVSRLRKVYGGKKNLGHQPGHKRPASGSIIRKILQQLEAAGLVRTEKGKGRIITPKGQSMVNRISVEIRKGS